MGSEHQYDAVILGAGPAGSAAARHLARAGVRTGLLERSRFDAPRIGETLAPEACQLLRAAGLDSVLQNVPGVAGPGSVQVWADGDAIESDFLFRGKGFARHLDRTAFDRALATAAAQAGADVKLGVRLRTCARHGDHWRGDFERDGRTESFAARWVLGATGRAGWLLNRLGVRPVRSDPLVAHVARLEHLPGADARLHLEAVPGGWWYFAPLSDRRGVAVFLTDLGCRDGAGARATWLAALERSALIRRRIGDARPHAVRVYPAGTRWVGTVAGPGWLALGDAALAYDPISGSGVARALTGAAEAARVLLAGNTGEALAEFQRDHDGRCRSYAAGLRDAYRLAARWPDDPFWSSRAERP